MLQKTLKAQVVLEGIGVHSGALSRVTMLPAAQNTGIVFVNAKDPSKRIVVGSVVPEVAMHATVLKGNGWSVSTVEHLMAALWMAGLTNLEIIVTGVEIPILDGSALLFCQAINDIGIVEQGAVALAIAPKHEVLFSDAKGRRLSVVPWHGGEWGLSVEYTADFKHPLVGGASFQAAVTTAFFEQEIAPARTFGFLDQLPMLRFHNLARGTSLGNSVVIGDDLMNEMRFADECVRHKVLDLIGDMALLGVQLHAQVKAHKTSHDFNRLLVEHYLAHPEAWQVV